jgi:hypothetical protein
MSFEEFLNLDDKKDNNRKNFFYIKDVQSR